MNSTRTNFNMLVAEDDAEDRMLLKDALEESCLSSTMHFVEDGEELLDYLYHRGKFADQVKYPTPAIILLDLNMPRKCGREALKEIKSSEQLRSIPVVMLTTSKAEEDVQEAYELGASSFITKPVAFATLVEDMRTLCNYWFHIVSMPQTNLVRGEQQ
jgi:CheY-like chemotaxis protein